LEKHTNPTWEYFKSIIFVILLVELFLFLTAMTFGRKRIKRMIPTFVIANEFEEVIKAKEMEAKRK